MFERQMQATLWTNHLAIAHEFPLWASDHTDLNRMEVWLAGGEVDRDLMMTCRDDAENCTDRWVRRAQSVILSVRGIFPKQGPAGREPKSLAIKKVAVKAALQTGAQVIFLADHEKMVGEYANEPLVFLASSDWEAAMKNNQVFLVTTTHPQATGEDRLFQKPRPGIECFKSCQWVFRRAMRERYIEV
jgi:hypothetical protein